MPKFSANLGFLWRELPLLDRITAAGRAGFRAVELHGPYDTDAALVRAACEANAVTLVSINAPHGDGAKGDFGLGALQGRRDDFKASIEQALAYARAAGASAVHVLAGIVAEAEKPRAREIFEDNLAWAALQAPDLTLLLEPINQRDAPGYFHSTTTEVVSLIGTVGAPNLRLLFDVYHAAIGEGDILTRLERLMPVIGHVQIAAVPSRAEPDEGEIAYPAIFDALDRHGYAGWVGCEYRPRAGTDAGLGWVDRLGVRL
ncbi:hydroxypyruvate isomerase [Hoeflea marina]|uniref:Hydroxypyruvate isomerase n=1 Tax=Hoeflea marina TaxID=274592 RepID=A0A317PGQ3_9HYPH|nr:TIM barrel protein [Hoeflea marina]PWV98051.1 hydroxypyruvate isomerase [Hoeflea marina]